MSDQDYQRRYYVENADEIKRRKREKYPEIRDARNARRRARRRANAEAARDADRKRYAATKETRAAQQRHRRATKPEHVRQVQREWRADRGRIYNATRRARKRNAFVEIVDPVVVFERDNYICQGCGLECPHDAKWPQLEAATVDHIIALANGGEHSYANTQTLCFGCNTSKGARTNGTPPVSDAGEGAHRAKATVTTH